MELLEIEKELAGAGGESALKRHDETLLALNVRMQAALGDGLPPAEYARCAALVEAVTVARKLLRLQLKRNDGELPSSPSPLTFA